MPADMSQNPRRMTRGKTCDAAPTPRKTPAAPDTPKGLPNAPLARNQQMRDADFRVRMTP
jgi:hypothetical protein